MPAKKHCCCTTGISCDDGTLEACFAGKCMEVTVNGFSNLGDCTECLDSNRVSVGPIYTPGSPGSFTFGSGAQCMIFFDTTYADGLIQFPVDSCFPFTVCGTPTRRIEVDFGASCHAGFSGRDVVTCEIEAVEADADEWANIGSLIDTLCAGGSISVPFVSFSDNGFCGYEGGDVRIRIVEASECSNPNPIITSYNCSGGTCAKVFGDSGTYATLADCMASSCTKPAVSYSCFLHFCTDPHDGSGTYSSLADCVAAGCGAPTCTSLDSCTPTLVAEVHGLAECTNGGDHYTPNLLDGVYFLDFDSIGGGISFYKGTVNPTPDDRDSYNAETQLYLTSVIGATTIETYVHAVEAHVSCTDGEVTITEWQWKLESFESTSGGPWSVAGIGTVSYTLPTSTLSGTVVGCISGFMLSIFPYTDCLSASQTVRISGNLN